MKRIKEIVIFILIIAVFLIWISLPDILKNTTLYFFGNCISESIFLDLLCLPVFAVGLVLHIKFFKEYNISKKIFYTLLSCAIIAGLVYITLNAVRHFSANEEINLPDGNKIVLYEEDIMQYGGRIETAIKVYKVKGIIAKRIGICWESFYCNEYCLKENKWDYTYNEADKKLTLILKYNEPKDENDPDVLEEEFTLE